MSSVSSDRSARKVEPPRHSVMVRVTHWITVLSFFALLLSGTLLVFSHPRFYWGETGNVNTHPLFTIPIPSSRDMVPTGYGYVLPDHNGPSRALHFQAAWVAVLTGLVYVLASLWNGHLRNNLFPARGNRSLRAVWAVFAGYFRRAPTNVADARSYNIVQRIAYLSVIFVLFPLVIWTGLAMSPAFDSAVPAAVDLLGGRQTARTLHFFVSALLVLFVVVHVAMVALAGFWSRVRAMITGRAAVAQESSVEESTAVR